jgi:nitrogen fixation protein NifU and related proteins
MFSAIVLDHFHNPRNTGPLDDATHSGAAGTPGDGRSMELWFRVVDGRIAEAAYRTYPCPAAIGCGSVVAEVARGRTVEQMMGLTEADIARLVGGLPEGKEHCSELAVIALRRVVDWTEKQR